MLTQVGEGRGPCVGVDPVVDECLQLVLGGEVREHLAQTALDHVFVDGGQSGQPLIIRVEREQDVQGLGQGLPGDDFGAFTQDGGGRGPGCCASPGPGEVNIEIVHLTDGPVRQSVRNRVHAHGYRPRIPAGLAFGIVRDAGPVVGHLIGACWVKSLADGLVDARLRLNTIPAPIMPRSSGCADVRT
jgi:hypothetical protein